MDKTFSYYGSAGATAGGGSGYHFNNDGQSLVKDDSDSGAEKADLSSWDWKDLDEVLQVIVVLKHRRKVNKLNLTKADELKNGNYKSAVGTWKSSNGKTITITSDGQLDFWGYTLSYRQSFSPNQYVSGIYTLTYVDSSPVGIPQFSFVLRS